MAIKRNDTAPDPIDLLGHNYDGSSKDWYVNSDEFVRDVEGETVEGPDFEESHAPDYGTYLDADLNRHLGNPLIGMERSIDDEE